jgi:hypothetical protein
LASSTRAASRALAASAALRARGRGSGGGGGSDAAAPAPRRAAASRSRARASRSRARAHGVELGELGGLGLERLLDGLELVVEGDALVLEPLDDLLVGRLDRHGLVILDHRFVQPILEDADLAGERGLDGGDALRVAQQVAQLVGQLLARYLLVAVGRRERVVPLAEHVVLVLEPRALGRVLVGLGRAVAAAVLLLEPGQLRLELLVLLAQRLGGRLVGAQLRLALLVKDLAVALEQRQPVLERSELLRGRARGHRARG